MIDRRFLPTVLGCAVLFVPASAPADIFKLKSGGEVRGELANADETPRVNYVVRPYAGGELTLPAEVVIQVVRQRPIEVEYERAKVKLADTVDDHWKMAEWCYENKLFGNRETHLQRIIELEPDHAEARRRLGHEKLGERWLTRDEIRKEKGYVKHGNRWVLPQELELIKKKEAGETAQREWHKKLALWRRWLDSDRAGAAKREILGIKDPAADKPLVTKLESEKDQRVRELYAEALGNLSTPEAVKTLVEYSINDPSRLFREHCRELIEKHKPPGARAQYEKALKDKDNLVVNRGAIGLGRLGETAAVRPLIDALITKHKFIVSTGGGGAGSISPTFSRDSSGGFGSAGLSSGGGGPKVIYRNLNNSEVLAALVKLTGQDFDFDVAAWKSWYAETKQDQQPAGNPRRD